MYPGTHHIIITITLMPCSKYKSKKQKGLCYATKGWTDWSKVKKKKGYRETKESEMVEYGKY